MKKKVPVLSIVICVILIAILGAVIVPAFFPSPIPLNQSVTVDALINVTKTGPEHTLAKIGDEYYEAVPSDAFSSYFYFESWELLDFTRDDEPAVTLRFGEMWVMEIYDDHQATVFNGYGSAGTRNAATYQIPTNVISLLKHYFEEHGIPHEFGDGTIGRGTFYH